MTDLTPIAARIVEEAWRYAGWGYGAGLSVAEQDAQKRIDCSSLTARILCAVWGEPIGGHLYSHLVLTADALAERGPWAPVGWVTDPPGLGEAVDLADLRPGEAALVQEWSRLPTDDDPGRGHAYIVIGSEYAGEVELLESTSRDDAGPSWRAVNHAGRRSQVSVDADLSLGWRVPIDSLGNHRAAVLYPRAPAAVAPDSPTAPAGPVVSTGAGAAVAQPHHTQEASMPRKNPVLRKLERAGYTPEMIEAIRKNTANDGKPRKAPGEIVEDIAEYAEPEEVLTLLQVAAEALADGFQPGDLLTIGAAVVALLRR